MTADDVKAELIQKMGPQLGLFWYVLRNELVWLHVRWDQYVELYGTSDERIKLLNETAPFFFAQLQDILWDDIVLHIARLIDEPGIGDREAFTIERIRQLVSGSPNLKEVDRKRVTAEVRSLVKAARTASQFVHESRNRRIAHHDLANALGRHPKPLNCGSRADVKGALAAFDELYRYIEQYFCRSHMDFTLAGTDTVGAKYLLRILAQSRKAEESRLERFQRGELRPDDFAVEPEI